MSQCQITPSINGARCAHCGRCIQVCPHHAIQLGEQGPVIRCTDEYARLCTYAGEGFLCLGEETCPNGVITWAFEIVVENNVQNSR